MLIMGYASYSSFQRVRYHFSPLYRQGYTTFISTPEVELEDGEMLAAITKLYGSSCHTTRLTLTLRYMPTKNPLVSKELAQRHGWEEE